MEPYPGSLPAGRLIEVDELARRLDDQTMRLFDVTQVMDYRPDGTVHVTDIGLQGYLAGHIPAAAYVDQARQLSDLSSPFNHTVPSAEYFARQAGRLGLGQDFDVVVYSHAHVMWATRMWWLLRYFGFDNVRVLNGGLDAWRDGGYPVETEPWSHEPTRFVATERKGLLASQGDVRGASQSGSPALVNALPAPIFSGEENPYGRPGRIPSSMSVPFTTSLQDGTWKFLEPREIRRRLSALGLAEAGPVIAYCGGGISATVDLFALSLSGLGDGRLYDGSLCEWVADPANPLVVGLCRK